MPASVSLAGELSTVSTVTAAATAAVETTALSVVASLEPACLPLPDDNGSSSQEQPGISPASCLWYAVARAWARPSDSAIACAYDLALLALE